MEKEIVLITYYFYPSKTVDSEYAFDLLKRLQKQDPSLKVHVVTTDASYKDNVNNKDVRSQFETNTIRIKSFASKTKNKYLKMFLYVIDGLRLVLKAEKLKKTNYIYLTNPPLISMWASYILRKKNLYYWTFDLYPDAFVADSIISSKNWFYKLLHSLNYHNQPNYLITLGPRQYDYLCKTGYKSEFVSNFTLPCGIHDFDTQLYTNKPLWFKEGKIILAYIGNLGRAHSLEFIKNIAKEVKDKVGFELVISVYGHHADEAINYVSLLGGQNIQIVEYVNKDSLPYVDVSIVSLNDNWTNISVPSKAVSAICAGNVLWFGGSRDSDTWQMFQGAAYHESMGIQYVLKRLTVDLLEKKKRVIEIKSKLIQLRENSMSGLNNSFK